MCPWPLRISELEGRGGDRSLGTTAPAAPAVPSSKAALSSAAEDFNKQAASAFVDRDLELIEQLTRNIMLLHKAQIIPAR